MSTSSCNIIRSIKIFKRNEKKEMEEERRKKREEDKE